MQKISMETKNCKKCGTSFEIIAEDLTFYEKISPVFAWKKYNIPSPTFCPDCRQQRRLAWRNENKLYKRKCDFSNKPIISIFAPDNKCTVYDKDVWWSDKWDALDYGQDFDFDRPFFQQFEKLLEKTPKMALINRNSENSDFCNNVLGEKDCYLIFIWAEDQNSYYSYAILWCKDCMDSLWTINSQLCYECMNAQTSYNCKYCFNVVDCADSEYLMNCIWVKNSLFCIWLTNKQYHILNKKHSKEDYENINKELKINKELLETYMKQFSELKKNFSYKANNIESSVDSTWDALLNCSNCKESFDLSNWQDSKFVYDSFNVTDSYDVYLSWTLNDNNPSQLLYESDNSVDIYNIIFSSTAWNCSNSIYLDNCFDCKDCFACCWLTLKQYCIFNKQYTKDDYEKLVPQIIEHMKTTGEWGEFFPSNISPFGYNETIANEYYPLEKEEAVAQGFNWQDKEYPVNIPEGMARIEAKDLPELEDLEDEMEKKILTTAIICEDSWKPYRIIQQELDFYKKHNIPLPKKHQDIRHINRMKFRNPRKLYDRNCDKCSVEIRTTYSPDRPETVFCKTCYEKEIL